MSVGKRILSAIFSGLFFACLMAGFYYFKDDEFNVQMFFAHAIGFGVISKIMNYFSSKKEK